MKTIDSLLRLFFDQLNDIDSMESQLCAALPKLASITDHQSLRSLIQEYLNDTNIQQSEVIEILRGFGLGPAHDKCKAMAGLIEGGDAHLATLREPRTRDLMMVAHCLRIAHYKIAAYQISQRLAERLELRRENRILAAALKREQRVAAALLELEQAIYDNEWSTPR